MLAEEISPTKKSATDYHRHKSYLHQKKNTSKPFNTHLRNKIFPSLKNPHSTETQASPSLFQSYHSNTIIPLSYTHLTTH